MWQPPTPEELAAVLLGFEVEAFIGRGGMGAVYRARQPALDRVVAIKLLPSLEARDAEFAERFRAEERALAKLLHPNIVAIYESGETADGHLFYAMEYVDGSDLAQRLSVGPLPTTVALQIAVAVCQALEYTHSRGIVHRDIKPANVLLGADGSVKVVDFGLAKEFVSTPEECTGVHRCEAMHTMTGTTLGTPTYMSPEQRAGRPLDGRTDLYSLGVMLYEMLTGELPQGAWRPPSHKSDSSARLDAVVEKVMQADPVLRVQSAEELRARLERVLYSMSPAGRRRRFLFTALAAACAMVGSVWLWQRNAAPEKRESAAPAPAAAPQQTPISPPGRYEPLKGLDPRRAAMTGDWHWLDDQLGGTLSITYTHEKPSIKILHLPLNPGLRGYDLKCEMLLEHRGGQLVFILPAGHARPALVFDLYDYSGLELVRGADWKANETAVAGMLPYGRFLPLEITVRPQGERVAIDVGLESKPFINWEGPQSDLSLPTEHYAPAMANHRGPVISLQSLYGAAQVRGLEVTILPKP